VCRPTAVGDASPYGVQILLFKFNRIGSTDTINQLTCLYFDMRMTAIHCRITGRLIIMLKRCFDGRGNMHILGISLLSVKNALQSKHTVIKFKRHVLSVLKTCQQLSNATARQPSFLILLPRLLQTAGHNNGLKTWLCFSCALQFARP
jgi:hypothetical protein